MLPPMLLASSVSAPPSFLIAAGDVVDVLDDTGIGLEGLADGAALLLGLLPGDGLRGVSGLPLLAFRGSVLFNSWFSVTGRYMQNTV